MASTPGFFSTPRHVGHGIPGNETDLNVPTAANSWLTAGANGTKIDRVTITAGSTTLSCAIIPCFVFLWIYDGAIYRRVDTIPFLGDKVTRHYEDDDFILVTGDVVYTSHATIGGTTVNSLWGHIYGADA